MTGGGDSGLAAWDFAVAAWERPGAAALALALQNSHGQSPPLLLWRLWTLKTGRAVTPATLAAAVQVARAWSEAVIDPLRAVRGRLGSPLAPFDESARLTLRDRLGDGELAAERMLIDALDRLTPATVADGADTALRALLSLTEAWRAPAPAALLARLIIAAAPRA